MIEANAPDERSTGTGIALVGHVVTELVEEVRGDDPELASYVRIEERGLAGGRN